MNIVYIVFAPLSINYAKFLNIQNFRKNGFNVHICDISSFFYSKKQSVSYFKSTKEFYKPHLENITNVSSLDELQKYLQNFENSNSLIYYR